MKIIFALALITFTLISGNASASEDVLASAGMGCALGTMVGAVGSATIAVAEHRLMRGSDVAVTAGICAIGAATWGGLAEANAAEAPSSNELKADESPAGND